jgi:predicted nucleic acid-binding Zn ribbon protein
MKRAGEILAPLMRRLTARDAPLPWLAGAWKSIVGSRLAAHTRPVKLSNGVLEISADSLELPPLASMVKKAVKRVVAKAGQEAFADAKVKATVKKVVKRAVKEAVKEVAEEAKPRIKRIKD